MFLTVVRNNIENKNTLHIYIYVCVCVCVCIYIYFTYLCHNFSKGLVCLEEFFIFLNLFGDHVLVSV